MTAPLSTRRPATSPAPAPRATPRTVPPLSVVRPAPRRRARLVTILVSVAVMASLFGLVASHVMLTQGQFRLESLRARAAAEQTRYERLRLQVAELESPARIVATAQERLGMVPPPTVTYLSPTGAVGASTRRDEAREADDGQAIAGVRTESAAEAEGYARVKRSLADPR